MMPAVAQETPQVSVRVGYPHPDLQPYVTFYYFVEAAGPLTDFLYPEWGNVRLNVSGDWMVLNDPRDPAVPAQRVLFGPTDRRGKIVTGGGKSVGFGLTPGGWARLIGSDASILANRVVEVTDQIDLDLRTLQAEFIAEGDDDAAGVARFDRALLGLLSRRPPTPKAALAVDHALRNQPRDVATFADMAGMSERTLHRICLRTFGFPPKRLLRRQRFLYTLGLLRVTPDPLLGTLIDPEYHDQSHFNRDFHDFMGMSAREYAATPRALMQAAAAAQQAIGIPLSFRLADPPTT
ncbi:helix-turn-helix domain-containing protein [Phenylobacterium sp.]|uniref:helix-turn-helix domain-containing protein n=1 Tax=Phenylobacterium sp. TaxID=1871053 RepID=UPI00301DFDCD